jgi:hypothetical protein
MNLVDLFILINVACIVVSWRVAVNCFNRGDKFWGNFNLFASALNAAIVVNHLI